MTTSDSVVNSDDVVLWINDSVVNSDDVVLLISPWIPKEIKMLKEQVFLDRENTFDQICGRTFGKIFGLIFGQIFGPLYLVNY